MNRLQTFEQFLATQSGQIPLSGIIIALILAAIYAYLLGLIYIKYGTSISNRKKFAANFILITMTTTLVITIVKSSLALSLGLVGALSIVRFRAAIKEPEELAYLFLAIGIGLGLGADQRIITTAAFAIIIIVILIKHFFIKGPEKYHNLSISISIPDPKKSTLTKIKNILSPLCTSISLKRFDESDKNLEALFAIEIDNFNKLEFAKEKIRELSKSAQITFLDSPI